MKKIQTLLASCALILAFNTPVMSDSSNFAGPYIGLQASTVGLGVGGKKTGGADDVKESNTASVGATGITAGLELGYAIPIGSALLLDIGGTYIDGTVSLRHSSDDVADSGDVKFQASQFYSYYIAPTLVLSDTSSLFVKIGQSEAAVDITGDVTNPGDLEGMTYAVGTRTVLDSGIFIRAEAGYTEYDALNAAGKGNNIATTTKYVADPEVAYGAISLGFRF
jgi:hypothetical protein